MRLIFRRYMPMRILVFTLLTLGIQAEAISCITPHEIYDGSVTIKLDDDPSSGIYHVRAPKEYEGKPIEYLVLSAKSEGNEIAVPLAIKSKNGKTGSYFYLSAKWLNVRVSANYEGSRCLSLVANLSM